MQDAGFLIQRGQARLVELEPEVTEEVAREAMKEASFGYLVD